MSFTRTGSLPTEARSMTTFSIEDLAALLHPQELELLEEIAMELEEIDEDLGDDDSDENAGSSFFRPLKPRPRSFSRLLLEVKRAARGEESQSFDPVFRNSPSDKPKRSPLTPLEKEIFEELDDELEDFEKDGRRLPAVLTPDEVRQIFDTVQASSSAKKQRDYLILRVMYATGCRRSELENMKLADFSFQKRRIFIRDGKWSKDRYALLDEQTALLLDDFTYGLALSDPIFGIGDRQIGRRIQHWAEASGVSARYEAQGRHFSSHALRHAYATHLYEAGMPLHRLRDLMGHRFHTTTLIYVHTGVGQLLEEYDSYHPLAQSEKKEDSARG